LVAAEGRAAAATLLTFISTLSISLYLYIRAGSEPSDDAKIFV